MYLFLLPLDFFFIYYSFHLTICFFDAIWWACSMWNNNKWHFFTFARVKTETTTTTKKKKKHQIDGAAFVQYSQRVNTLNWLTLCFPSSVCYFFFSTLFRSFSCFIRIYYLRNVLYMQHYVIHWYSIWKMVYALQFQIIYMCSDWNLHFQVVNT